MPNLVLSTARNRFTTKYGPKNTSSTKYGTATSDPESMIRYITCAHPARVVHWNMVSIPAATLSYPATELPRPL